MSKTGFKKNFYLFFVFLFISTLSYASDNEIIDLIKDLGNKDKSKSAIDQLVEKNEQALIPELFFALGDSNILLRKNAGQVIEKIGKPSIDYLSQIIKNPEIKNPIKDYAITLLGKIKDDAVIPVLIEGLSMDNNFLRTNIILTLKEKGEVILPYIQKKLENSPNVNFRRSISGILNKINKPESTKILLKMLDDEDVEVRRNVASNFGNSQNSEVLDKLAKKMLEKDEDIDVKRGAALSLKMIGTKEAFVAIINVFRQKGALKPNCSCEHDKKPVVPRILGEFPIFIREDVFSERSDDAINFITNNFETIHNIANDPSEDIQIRYLMFDIISDINSPNFIPFYIEAFNFNDIKFRIMAIYSLRRMPDKAVPYIIEYVKKDESEHFLGSISEVLIKQNNYINPIMDTYKTGTVEIKKRIIKILVLIGDMNALAFITLKGDKDERMFIANTIKEQKNAAYFINILQIDDFDLTISALNSLAELRNAESIPFLFNLLKDKDPKIQEAAKQTIKSIIIKKNAEFYIKTCLNKKQTPETKTLFREILTGFGSDITPILINNLNNKDDSIKNEVSIILSQIGVPAAPELIKIIIDKKNKELVNEAVIIIKKMDVEILSHLIDNLDSSENIIIYITKEIVNKNQEKSVPYLIKGLKNEKQIIRIICAEILADQKDANALPVLLDTLGSENKTFQLKATFALVKFGEIVLKPVYKEWEKHNISSSWLTRLFKKEKNVFKGDELKSFNSNVNKIFFTIGEPALDKLIIMVDAYNDLDKKIEILKFFKNLKNKKISPIFIKNLQNENLDIVIISIEGLSALKDKDAENPLKDLLKNTNNTTIRQSAVIALKQITGEDF